MRTRIFIAISCGVLGIFQVTASAQTGFENKSKSSFGQKPESNRGMQFFSRGKKEPAETSSSSSSKTTSVKNYHEQLFGSKPPSRSYRNRQPARLNGDAGITRIKMPAKKTTRPSSETTKANSRVIHAEFLNSPNADGKRKSHIQQIAGSDDNLDNFNPFKEFGPELSAKKQQPVSRSIPNTSKPFEEGFNPFSSKNRPVANKGLGVPHPEPVFKQSTTKPKRNAFQIEGSPARNLANTEPQTPQVTIGWEKVGEFNVGQECVVNLVVKNNGSVSASNLSIEAYFPKYVRLLKASPKPQQAQDHISWTIASLKAGEEQRMTINLIPSQRGDLDVNALVRFTGSATGSFSVNEPMLALALKAPKQVLLGQPASQTITVTNPGTGIANDIIVEASIPAGLQHPKGSYLTLNIGSLSPRESRTIHLALVAINGRQQQVKVIAKTKANLVRTAVSSVNVVAPSLSMKIT